MTFKKLHQDTECNCLESAIQDNDNLYARKINKPIPLDRDFNSHWERGKRAEICNEICGYKGLSINKWDEDSKNAIINKFLTTFGISPKHKDSIFVFRITPETGVVEYTPTQNDKTHFDFYKSDDFTLEMLETHIVLPLKDFISNE